MALLPALVSALLRRDAMVTVQDSGGLLRTRGSHPNLKVLGFVEDFAGEIAGCDLVVWPSSPSGYASRTSGIIWNAIAAGVPLVLPSVCLPAQIAHEQGAAVFYHHHSVPAILKAVQHARRSYTALAALAEQKAWDWSVTEGVDRLAVAIQVCTGGAVTGVNP